MRTGTLRIEPEQVTDATTRGVVTEVVNSLDREQMLAELKRLRRSRVGVIQPPARRQLKLPCLHFLPQAMKLFPVKVP